MRNTSTFARAALAALTVLLSVGVARAATIITTFTGNASGYDTDGVFGPAGTEINDRTFKVVYTSTTEGNVLLVSGPGIQFLYGGSGYNAFDPLNYPGSYDAATMADFTLFDGMQVASEYHFDGAYYSHFFLEMRDTHSIETQVHSTQFDYINTGIYSSVNAFISDASVLSSVSRVLSEGDVPRGAIRIGGTRLSLAPQSVTSYVLPLAVPEPAEWMLLVAGFCSVGLALRRNRSEPNTSVRTQ